MTITIQLESGGRRDIDIDLISEYGMKAPLVVIPPMPAHGQPFEQYRSGKPYYYIKVKPFNDMLTITRASLEEVHKRKEEKKALGGLNMNAKHKCYRCELCRPHFDQYGWGFYGCHGGDYHGKFIGEINECPSPNHKLMSEKRWDERK